MTAALVIGVGVVVSVDRRRPRSAGNKSRVQFVGSGLSRQALPRSRELRVGLLQGLDCRGRAMPGRHLSALRVGSLAQAARRANSQNGLLPGTPTGRSVRRPSRSHVRAEPRVTRHGSATWSFAQISSSAQRAPGFQRQPAFGHQPAAAADNPPELEDPAGSQRSVPLCWSAAAQDWSVVVPGRPARCAGSPQSSGNSHRYSCRWVGRCVRRRWPTPAVRSAGWCP